MPVLVAGALWAGLVSYLLSRILRQFGNYRRASVSPASGTSALPWVSVIVPARNEAANIGQCLAGLSAQTGIGERSSIFVVDDNSQDGTGAAVAGHAAADPRIRLVDAGALPAGWVGKPHACWRGAALATGDWLCFVDADVRVAPGLLAAAVATAQADGVDMLSLHPLQELGSFWERLIMPAGLLVLACAKPFEPGSHDIVNGQFLLIRREAYFAVGGHARVRAEICEDKALAGLVRAQGFRLRVLAAEQFARTRMYRDLGSLWEGLSKNTTEVLGSVRATLIAAAAALVFGWAAVLLPAATLSAALARPSGAAIAGVVLTILGTGVVIGVHVGTARHFRVPAAFGLTFPAGFTGVACLACCGVVAQLTGRVRWKGRTYPLAKTAPERA
jgi:chlorobactene glucosyltransferase